MTECFSERLSTLGSIRALCQRLAWVPGLDHPVWVDDDRFNINFHLRHTRLPLPGNERMLKRVVGRVLAQPLCRSRQMGSASAEPVLDPKARCGPLLPVAVAAPASRCTDPLAGRNGGALNSALADHVGDQLGRPRTELTVYTSSEGSDSDNPEIRCEGMRSIEIEVFFEQRS